MRVQIVLNQNNSLGIGIPRQHPLVRQRVFQHFGNIQTLRPIVAASMGLIFASGFAAGVVLFAPTRTRVTGDELPTGKDVFGVAPRVFAAVGSGVAAVIIVAGGVWSAWRPRRSGLHLVIGNLLIAVATLILSASGTLAGRLGKDRAFAITLLIGICVLFAGFLIATARVIATAQVATAQVAEKTSAR